jgi:hypothetical protein
MVDHGSSRRIAGFLAASLFMAAGCAGSHPEPAPASPPPAAASSGARPVAAGDSLPQLSPDTLAELRAGPPRPYRGAVLFTYVSRRARSVAVAGTFNGWVPTAYPLRRRELAPAPGSPAAPDSLWYALAPAPRGKHQYKFLVDGSRWILDPANPERSGDGAGGLASVFIVR